MNSSITASAYQSSLSDYFVNSIKAFSPVQNIRNVSRNSIADYTPF